MSETPMYSRQGSLVKTPKATAELLIFHRPARQISPWWQISQLFSFFVALISGIATCIALGRISNAFGGQCILYGEISLARISRIEPYIRNRHVQVTLWGRDGDCNYCQYFPMAGACAAMILGAIFLEFSSRDNEVLVRAGSNARGNSWQIVVPAFLISFVFFVMSCVALANTVGGLLYFCENILQTTMSDEFNLTSCVDVYSLPWELDRLTHAEVAKVDVYTNFLISEIGTSLHFFGWFLSLFILMIRCGASVDFITVQRKRFPSPFENIETIPITDNLLSASESDSLLASSEDEEEEDETTLSIKPPEKLRVD